MQVENRRQGSVGAISPPEARPLPLGRHRLVLALLLVLVATFNLLTLLRTPPPFVDDAWYASRAWSLIHTGHPFSTLDAGVLDRYDGYWTYFPRLVPWLSSLVFRILGLSLFSTRLVSLIFGMLLLGAVYSIGLRLGGAGPALLAVLLTSLSSSFLCSSHLGRPDVVTAAFGFSAIALYLADDTLGPSLSSLLAGLTAGLALEIHPNAIVYCCTVAALCAFDHGRSVLRTRRLWGLIGGMSLGALCYLALHVLRYPQTYQAITYLIIGDTRIPPVLALDPGVWFESAANTLALLARSGPFRFVAVAPALVLLLRRRSSPNSRAIALFIILMLAFAGLIRHKPEFYAIILSPAADLLVALSLCTLVRRRYRYPESRPVRLALLLLVVVMCALLVADAAISLPQVSNEPMPEYEYTLQHLRQVVLPGHSVIGPQTYWFGLSSERYLSWESLAYYLRHAPGSTLEDAFRGLRPDYFILDSAVEHFAFTERGVVSDPYAQLLQIPRSELDTFLDGQAELVSSLRTSYFGKIRVYRIHWDEE